MRVHQLGIMLTAAEVCLLIACAHAQTVERDQPIVLNTRLVSITVVVTDQQGRALPGLEADHFRVFDNQVEQQISHFSRDDGPASVGVVFDLSGSMLGSRITLARQALERLLETSHPDDEYFIFGFDSKLRLVARGSPERKSLFEELKQIEPRGDTALYDASCEAIETFEQARHRRRALIILSDGEDNQSRLGFRELRRRIIESGVLVYTVMVGSIIPHSPARAILNEMASSSGGRAFFPVNEDGLDEAFGRIANEVRRSYSIAYQPSEFVADGSMHRIKVDVRPPQPGMKIAVRTRKGYVARGSEAEY
jgi:Ca-activated chloride channel family protein